MNIPLVDDLYTQYPIQIPAMGIVNSPLSQHFSPSGEHAEHRKLAYGL